MFEDEDDRGGRRNREAEARAKAANTRRALLDLLREGPMTGADLRTKLAHDAPISVVNYHLSVLMDNRTVVTENGFYRLA